MKPGGHDQASTAVQIGSTVKGTVVKVADYGAIVRLGGGKMGLVHVSEIADTYVRDVREYIKENDRISVKVLKLNQKGRYELSARQADGKAAAPNERGATQTGRTQERGVQQDGARAGRPVSFEDKLSRFMKDSEERLHDLKRNMEAKQGVRRK